MAGPPPLDVKDVLVRVDSDNSGKARGGLATYFRGRMVIGNHPVFGLAQSLEKKGPHRTSCPEPGDCIRVDATRNDEFGNYTASKFSRASAPAVLPRPPRPQQRLPQPRSSTAWLRTRRATALYVEVSLTVDTGSYASLIMPDDPGLRDSESPPGPSDIKGAKTVVHTPRPATTSRIRGP